MKAGRSRLWLIDHEIFIIVCVCVFYANLLLEQPISMFASGLSFIYSFIKWEFQKYLGNLWSSVPRQESMHYL